MPFGIGSNRSSYLVLIHSRSQGWLLLVLNQSLLEQAGILAHSVSFLKVPCVLRSTPLWRWACHATPTTCTTCIFCRDDINGWNSSVFHLVSINLDDNQTSQFPATSVNFNHFQSFSFRPQRFFLAGSSLSLRKLVPSLKKFWTLVVFTSPP